MSDIVKMLRSDDAGSALDHMAADEIERLNKRIVRMEKRLTCDPDATIKRLEDWQRRACDTITDLVNCGCPHAMRMEARALIAEVQP